MSATRRASQALHLGAAPSRFLSFSPVVFCPEPVVGSCLWPHERRGLFGAQMQVEEEVRFFFVTEEMEISVFCGGLSANLSLSRSSSRNLFLFGRLGFVQRNHRMSTKFVEESKSARAVLIFLVMKKPMSVTLFLSLGQLRLYR